MKFFFAYILCRIGFTRKKRNLQYGLDRQDPLDLQIRFLCTRRRNFCLDVLHYGGLQTLRAFLIFLQTLWEMFLRDCLPLA